MKQEIKCTSDNVTHTSTTTNRPNIRTDSANTTIIFTSVIRLVIITINKPTISNNIISIITNNNINNNFYLFIYYEVI
jgi:hypothetical protein